MELKELIINTLSNITSNRIEPITFNNYNFNLLSVSVKTKDAFPLATKYVKRGFDYPTLLIWKLKDGCKYQWYDLVTGECKGKVRTFFDHSISDNAYYFSDYFVKDFEKDFNTDQALALIDGSYWQHHNKYIDIFSEDTSIIKIFRDRFDLKRYRTSIDGFQWYFYIKTRDQDAFASALQKHNCTNYVRKLEQEDKWIRVYCNKVGGAFKFFKEDNATRMLEALKIEHVQTFEGDLDLEHRYIIDNDVKVETSLKVLYYDIETDDTTDQIVVGRDRILSIAAVDRDGNVFYKTSKNEKTILDSFTEYVKDYDIIVGFNSYNFDDPYIVERCRNNNIYYKTSHRDWRLGHIDMMKRIIGTYGRLSDLKSFSLENISQFFLGRGKVQRAGKVIELFNNDKELLKEYNIMDCTLLKDIDEKTGVVDLMIAMCEWTGMFPSNFRPTKNISGVSVSKLLDMFILRHAKKDNIHYRTVDWTNKEDETFLGGLVMDAIPGIYKDVYILDFKSLYPSIIWSWKISPENMVSDTGFKTREATIESANNVQFYKNRKAVFPTLVEELISARKAYKKKQFEAVVDSPEYKMYSVMQQVAKELTNALYGQLGQRGGRYYHHLTAGAVTAAGRDLLLTTKQLCLKRDIKVIYGDTDSVFVSNVNEDINELVVQINKEISQYIQKQFRVDKSIVELEYEKRMGKFIQIKKKNYVGLLTEQDGKQVDKVLVRGLEYIKRSTIALAKEEQKKLVDSLLRNDYDVEYYVDWVKKVKASFYNRQPDLEEITLRTSISKPPSEFKAAKLAHVRVAEWLIENKLEFYVGMQVPYIVVNKKKKIEIHPSVYNGEFDREYYWERIYSPLQRILEVCFKDYNWWEFDENQKVKMIRKIAKEKKLAEKEKLRMTELNEIARKGRFVIKATVDNVLFDDDSEDEDDNEY